MKRKGYKKAIIDLRNKDSKDIAAEIEELDDKYSEVYEVDRQEDSLVYLVI